MKQDYSDNQLKAIYSEATSRDILPRPDREKAWTKIMADIASRRRRKKRALFFTFSTAAAAVVLLVVSIFSTHEDTIQENNQPAIAFAAKPSIGSIVVTNNNDDNKAIDIKEIRKKGVRIDNKEADFRLSPADDASRKTVIIPRGKLYKITLSDGSEVWLNADSRLTFPSHFVGDKRMVSLEGEAYFKVAKDPRHPFIVKCGEIETMVLGTEFNIRSYNNQPEVALISGSVAVKDSRDHTFTLTPGQAVTLFDEGFQAREIDTEYYKKWREGMFYFEEASLLEVMCEIGRWYNVNINIVDPELNDYKLHFAADREESISQIIQYLACLSYLDISKKGNLITIRKKNI